MKTSLALSLIAGATAVAAAVTLVPTASGASASAHTQHARATSSTAAAQEPSSSITTRVPVTQLHMLNYAPAQAPWTKMWTDYNHAQVASDFQAIAGLGANSVRLIIQPYAVGWPQLTSTGAANIRDAVRTAEADGLSVQFTLFDWIGPYSDIPDSINWMRSVLSPFAGDPGIALVEVQNEIDPSQSVVLNWTRQMLEAVKTMLPGVPRTVSVGGSQTSAQMQELTSAIGPQDLDVIDTHLYGVDSVIQGKIQAAQSVAQGRPVFVGEMGQVAQRGACAAQAQASFFSRMQLTLVQAHITGYAVWTLNDIAAHALPTKYQGSNTGSFGLRRANGNWKPAAAVVKAMFEASSGGATTQSLSADESRYGSFDGNFNCDTGALPSSSASGSTDTWVIFQSPLAKAAGVQADAGVSGSRAAFLGQAGGDPRSAVPSVMHSFPVLGSGAVTVRAQVRLVNATGTTNVSIAWFAGTKYLSSKVGLNAVGTSAGWQALTVSDTPPSGATMLQIHLRSYGNSGTAFFDNITLTPNES